jgi:hypothetical protein
MVRLVAVRFRPSDEAFERAQNLIYVVTPVGHPDEIRYVGQTMTGLEQRRSQHLADARMGRGSLLHAWIREIGESAVEFHEHETFPLAVGPHTLDVAEAFWIRFWRMRGAPLLNVSKNFAKFWDATGHVRVSKHPDADYRAWHQQFFEDAWATAPEGALSWRLTPDLTLLPIRHSLGEKAEKIHEAYGAPMFDERGDELTLQEMLDWVSAKRQADRAQRQLREWTPEQHRFR